MNQIDTNTLIAICTCAIGLTKFIWWKHIAKVKAYESEKGKNLATKEDIGEITREIKSVESKFTLLTNLQTGILSEERNAIAEFAKSITIWINSYQRNFKLEQGDIESFLEDISIAQDKCNFSYSTLQILVDNQDLIESAALLMDKVSNFNRLQTDIKSLKQDCTISKIEAYQRVFKGKYYNNITDDINSFFQLSRKYIRRLINKPEH